MGIQLISSAMIPRTIEAMASPAPPFGGAGGWNGGYCWYGA